MLRYIHFSKIIGAYPRLIVCQLSFEAIMIMHNELLDHIGGDEELKQRLSLPLKNIEINADMTLKVDKVTNGSSEEVLNLGEMTSDLKGLDWGAMYELSDEKL